MVAFDDLLEKALDACAIEDLFLMRGKPEDMVEAEPLILAEFFIEETRSERGGGVQDFLLLLVDD